MFCGAALGGHGEEVKITSYNLGGWTIDGALPASGAEPASFKIPAAGGISRVFSSPSLTLRLETRPAFVSDPGACALLQIGEVVVAFIQHEGLGRLLVLDEKDTARLLETTVPLSAEGTAAEAIALDLQHRAGGLVLRWGKEQIALAVEATGPTAKVSFTSGAMHDWEIELLVIGTPDGFEIAGSGADARGSDRGSESDERIRRALEAFDRSAAGSSGALRGKSSSAGYLSKAMEEPGDLSSALEIFTPPATRSPRLEPEKASRLKS